MTYDGDVVTWYVDGIADRSYDDVDAFPATGTAAFVLGDEGRLPVDVDEVALHDHALSADRVAARLRSALDPPSVSFAYDGNGLRVRADRDGEITTYRWDQLRPVPEVAVEQTEGETRRWVHGLGPLQVGVNGAEYFLHENSVGSTVAVSDGTGALVQRFDYDAFGVPTLDVREGDGPDGLARYADGTWEPQLGMWFLRARYYDPSTGRFNAIDPVPVPHGSPYGSRYAYVDNRPTVLSDPTGLRAIDAAGDWVGDRVGQLQAFVQQQIIAPLNRDLAALGVDLHAALDVVGMVPVVGEAADLVNGVLYLAEGRYADAALSFAAIVPLVGSAAVGARITMRYGDELAAGVRGVTSGFDEGIDAMTVVGRSGDELSGFARGGSNFVEDGADLHHADVSVSRSSGPSCARNSFLPGTRILLADGTTEEIEDLDVGDEVLAADPTTGEQGARAITHLIAGYGVKLLATLTLEGGEEIVATDEHPIWAVGRGWVDAVDLVVGDSLIDEDGQVHRVAGVSLEVVDRQQVHNLTVADLHTFYVVDGDAAVLTHNCGVRTGETPGGMSRVSTTWRQRYGPSATRQHHLIPQATLNNETFTQRMADLGVDDVRGFIDQRVAAIPNAQHQAVHAAGWNDAWTRWIEQNPRFTMQDLNQRIRAMMGDFNIPRVSRNGPSYGN